MVDEEEVAEIVSGAEQRAREDERRKICEFIRQQESGNTSHTQEVMQAVYVMVRRAALSSVREAIERGEHDR